MLHLIASLGLATTFIGPKVFAAPASDAAADKIAGWLEEAGSIDPRLRPAADTSPLILATRPPD